MEINSTSQGVPVLPQERGVTARKTAAAADSVPSAEASVSGVQDQVSLSDAAVQAASADAGDQPVRADEGGEQSLQPSPVKSFVYGTLGLERPDAEPQPPQSTSDQYYNAGRWLAAAATVGTLVSLLA